MNVTVLTPDVSHNCLGRAHLLAELLSRTHDVQIVGPQFGDGVWSPVADDYDYEFAEAGSRLHSFCRAVPALLRLIDGDVVLVSKPRMQSYGVGLLKTLGEEYPLVLDIDDWETGFTLGEAGAFSYLRALPTLVDINSLYYKLLMERLVPVADELTVSNRFLADRFGGEIIPHVRDTDAFDPDRFSSTAARREFDLPPDDRLIMFSGTPRPHKGVEDLVHAVSELSRDDTRVVLVGAHDSDYVDELRRLGGDSLIVRGQQPFDTLPRWIAAADVVAIPQRDRPETLGQLPAKVFDAMAMGKPIVATAVSDLPEILDGCGLVVDPESPRRLREAIVRLLDDPTLRDSLGRRARRRCIERYSHDAVAPQLSEIVRSAVE
jgi:glycosyltransferase involved in cell wall biosynthesis